MSKPEKRRLRGEGTIEQVGEMWRFKSPDGSGGRYTSPAEYADAPAAIRGLAIYRQKIIDGELVPVRGLTLRQYVENTWLPRMEKRRPRSIARYRSVWRSQIDKAPFAARPIASLKRRDVRAWSDSLSVNRPEAVVSVLCTILSAAIDDEIITINPALRLGIERQRRTDTCPTPEEEQAILTCKEIPREDRLILAFASSSLMRPGEWRSLHLADLVTEGRDPHINVRFGSIDSEGHCGPTKGKRARVVPLFGFGLEVAREWLRLLPTYAPENPHGLVFPHADGRPRLNSSPLGLTGSESKNVWHVYRELAGVHRKIRLHDFRHRGATALLQGDLGRQWSLREVQGLLGHASLTTTEQTYAHDLLTVVERAAAEQRTVQNSPAMVTNALISRQTETSQQSSA